MKPEQMIRFQEHMEVRGLSMRTIETYCRIIQKFSEHYLRLPDEVSDEEVRHYLLYLQRDRKYARPTMIGVTSALRAYYQTILQRDAKTIDLTLPRRKSAFKLPKVYSIEEIEKLLYVKGIRLEQQVMLTVAYSAGLRPSEICRLRIEDILSQRMQIRVEQGKGNVDRYTILSPKLLNLLRHYWRKKQPKDFLFPSPKKPNLPVNVRSVQRAFAAALEMSGLPNRGGIYALRHSFASHLYEMGTSLVVIKELLGHRWLTTTMIYLHVTNRRSVTLRSPLDELKFQNTDAIEDRRAE